MRHSRPILASWSLPLLVLPLAPGHAQDRLERANPERVQENQPDLPQPATDAPPPMIAPSPGGAAPAGADDVRLNAIVLDGLTEVEAASLDPVLRSFLDRPLATDELKGVVNAVVSELRSRGYVFASARIPAQSVEDGRLRVLVDEGFVEGVRIEGYDGASTRRVLERLVDGRPVTQGRLERQILLAGDGRGIDLGRSSYGTFAGRSVLSAKAERDRWSGRVSLDNWGSEFIGPFRARTTLYGGGLFDGADEVRLDASLVPLQPREFGYVRGGYSRLLDGDGLRGTLTGSYGRTRPGEYLRERDTTGLSWSVGAELSYPFIRSGALNIWTDLGLQLRRSSQDQFAATVRDDRFTNLTADLYGYGRLGDARLRGRVSAIQGLGLFNSTRAGDPDASRRDGSARFTSVFLSAGATVPVVARVELELSAEGQLASRPLLSSEEFGIGGAEIGRGYDYSERLGDQGVAGAAELRYLLDGPVSFVEKVRLLAFLDGGVTDDLGVSRFDGSLASAGLGVAIELPNKVAGQLTAGFPLTGPRETTGDSSPRIGFVVGTRF